MQINTIYESSVEGAAKSNNEDSKHNKIIDSIYNVNENLKEKNYSKAIKEVKVLEEINKLINSDFIKRAYASWRQRSKIDNIVFKLKNPSICIGDGYCELINIYNELKEIEEKESELENDLIKTIQEDVGSQLWNDFEQVFKTEDFLKHIVNNFNTI